MQKAISPTKQQEFFTDEMHKSMFVFPDKMLNHSKMTINPLSYKKNIGGRKLPPAGSYRQSR